MRRALSVVTLIATLALYVPVPARAASALTPAQIEALLTSPLRRVRTTEAGLAQILGEGLRRSSTFGDLMLALHRTNVIVYIQSTPNLPSTLAGRLLLMSGPNEQRYLRIQVRTGSPRNEMIALIGHELRHAIEIGDAPDVQDEATLIGLYERIGVRGGGTHHYDTVAAQDTGRRVRVELGA